MAYSAELVDLIREQLQHLPDVEEKYMFGGMAFMVNGKMCIGVLGDEMMCRINPELEGTLLENPGVRPMDFSGRPMKGYVMVDQTIWEQPKWCKIWIQYCLNWNPNAKKSGSKKS